MPHMERFRHEDWMVDLYVVEAEDSQAFCGVADIALGVQQRCKIVLSRPKATCEEGIAVLRTKCLIWIRTEGAKPG